MSNLTKILLFALLILRGPVSAKNVLTDAVLTDISVLQVPANTCWILEIL